jgi:hypothetical protein
MDNLHPELYLCLTKLGSTGNVLNIQNATWRAGGTGTEDAGTKWSTPVQVALLLDG